MVVFFCGACVLRLYFFFPLCWRGSTKNRNGTLNNHLNLVKHSSIRIQSPKNEKISSEIKAATAARRLTEVGELEQALVGGDKGGADLVKYLAGALAVDLSGVSHFV